MTETFAILAKRRAGKSNAAVVMAEEMYAAGLPWVAVDPKGDWYGVRASGDGRKPGLAVIVFGGLHADVPLEPASGRLVAGLFAERRLSGVLDVSEMTKADQRRSSPISPRSCCGPTGSRCTCSQRKPMSTFRSGSPRT